MPIPFTCPHCGAKSNVADQYAGQTGPCSGCGKPVSIPGGTVSPAAPLPQKSSSAWLIVLLIAVPAVFVLLCVVGGLVALLFPAVQAAREAANRASCSNHLKQIALALQTYHDVYKKFPAAYVADKDGKPMHSWRVAILPFLEHGNLFDQYNFNEPWDGPNNRKLHDQMPDVFRCPSSDDKDGYFTHYMVVVGKGTMFEGNQWFSLAAVIDGTSNTVAVVEVAGSKTHWMKPQDLDLATMPMKINAAKNGKCISSDHPMGVMAALCDGSVHFLSNTTSPQKLRNLIIKDDGNAVDLYDY